MGWFTKKTSGNELGEYLPDDEAQITEKSERLQANSQPEAVNNSKFKIQNSK
jgi:hypothetical protein